MTYNFRDATPDGNDRELQEVIAVFLLLLQALAGHIRAFSSHHECCLATLHLGIGTLCSL